MKVQVLAVLLLGAVAAAAVASVDFSGRNHGGVSATEGDLTLELKVPPDERFETISYEVSGDTKKLGAMDLSGGERLVAHVGDLSAATDYSVQLTASRKAASVCQGSAAFDIVAGQTTRVSFKLGCPEPSQAQALHEPAQHAAANRCPRVQSATAVPSADGRTVTLVGVAADPDQGPTALTYQWTAAGKQVANAAAASSTLDCSTAGEFVAKLEVSDGACRDSFEQNVVCFPIAGGSQGATAAARATDSTQPGDPAHRTGSGAYVVGASKAQQVPGATTSTGAPSSTTAQGAYGTSANTTGTTQTSSATNSPTTTTNAAKSGGPGTGVGSSGITSCSECESVVHEGSTNCTDSKEMCDNLKGVTESTSPMPGIPRAALCRKIVDCMHSTHCAAPDALGISSPADCFCGLHVQPNDCFALGTYASATGPCKELIAGGSESMDITQIGLRIFDVQFAAGAAEGIVETCDSVFCKQCL